MPDLSIAGTHELTLTTKPVSVDTARAAVHLVCRHSTSAGEAVDTLRMLGLDETVFAMAAERARVGGAA